MKPDEVASLRAQFPILGRTVRGYPLTYLDWAATAQKPEVVIDAENRFYREINGAVNRGSHALAEESTVIYEAARAALADFIGGQAEEVIWTKNATEAINLITSSLLALTQGRRGRVAASGKMMIGPDYDIVVTRAEHHANLVPWQELCARTGATLRWLDLTPDGRIDLETLDVITDRTAWVAVGHISNVTGAIAPVDQIVAKARKHGAYVLLDACQSAPHIPLDVRALDVDAIALSGHKMCGPTGIGALWARAEILAALPPFMTGGSMVETVTMEGATYKAAPLGFEAGTQATAQIAGMEAAIRFLTEVGMDKIFAHEQRMIARMLEAVDAIDGVRILGPRDARDRIAVLAFAVEDVHPHDVGQLLDSRGVAVRVGHHCAQPIHQHLGVRSSARASAGLATSDEDIDTFAQALATVRPFFHGG